MLPRPPEATPAFKNATFTLPYTRTASSAMAFTDSRTREVGRHAGDIEQLPAHLGHDLFDRGSFDVREDHLHAELGEHLARRTTDATGTAGDDRDLAGEVLHISSLSSIHCGSRIAGPPLGAGSGSVHVPRTRAPMRT